MMMSLFSALLGVANAAGSTAQLKCYVRQMSSGAQLDLTIPYDSVSGLIHPPVTVVAKTTYVVNNQMALPRFDLGARVTGMIDERGTDGCAVRALIFGGDGSRIYLCHRATVRDGDAVRMVLAPGGINRFVHDVEGDDANQPANVRGATERAYVADCEPTGRVP